MSPTMHRLEVAPPGGAATVRVRVTGEVDASNAEAFEADLRAAIDHRPATVVLSALDFIDSAGIAALGRLADDCDLVFVVAPDAIVRRAIDIVGRHHLPIVDTEPAD